MKALNAGILAAIILAPGANAITLQADADAYVRGGGNSGTTNGTFNDLLVANSSVPPLAIGALGGMALLANRRRASLSPTRSKA